jgi:hypothetical protein
MTADTGNGTGPGSGPPSWPWVARPAGWFLSSQEPDHEGQPESADPGDYENARPGRVVGEWFVAGQDEPQNYWYEDEGQEEPEQGHVVGPTAALNGLPGGPGFAVPPGAVAGPADERSPWEQADGVWRGSGIVWEQAEVAGEGAAGSWEGGPGIQVPPGFGGRPGGRPGGGPGGRPDGGRGEDPSWGPPGRGFSQPNSALSAPTMADAPVLPQRTEPGGSGHTPHPAAADGWAPSYDGQSPPTRAETVYDGQSPPTRAETVYDGQSPPTRAQAVYDDQADQADWASYDDQMDQADWADQAGWQVRPPERAYRVTWPSEPRTSAGADEREQVSEVWRNQQLRYPDLPRTRTRVRRVRRRRPVALTVLKVGVPVFVIVAVGAGAVMMLTGKTKMVLAERGDTTTPPRASTAGSSGAAGRTTPSTNTPAMAVFAATLPGYPGRGVSGELVEGLASGNGTALAVGTVDGLPAVWRRATNGSWSLVTQNTAGITNRAAVLTTIVRGPGGWVAVGVLGNNAAPHPVVLVSADGKTWQFVDGEQAFGYPGAYAYGAAAGPSGYLVVGKIVHGGRTIAATWWSTDLYHWVRDGSNGGLDGRLQPSQMLAAAATPGGFIAVGQHGSKPAAWITGSARNWKVIDLPVPAGATSAAFTRIASSGDRVVALGDAATSKGVVPFAAVSSDGGASWREVSIATPGGRAATVTAVTATASGFTAAAQAGGTDAIYWTSADGTAWSVPRQAGSGIAAITGLTPSGSTMAGIGESPAGRAVIWAAG